MKQRKLDRTDFWVLFFMYAIITIIFTSMASCKKDIEVEPIIDDVVATGTYLNLDRWGTDIYVAKPDTLKVRLSIGTGTNISSWFIRRYPNSVGYEWEVTTKKLRFKKIDKGYEIVGDTLAGIVFTKI
jgi:hypothetical protein